jgi:hypothetical protein
MAPLPPRVAKPSLQPDPDPNDFTEEDLEDAQRRLRDLDGSHVNGPQ